ncbi:MAG TPA: hypothetical protein VL970_13150, partial [Candidatus Acidoferrales bacterium]|nr:hypothetical protein [Candidatus Acidoferrales bacterium]
MPTSPPTHHWRFFRAGGFDQVKLDTGADLMNLDQLDQKLWVALACPIAGLEFDPKTAALIDTDHDGRIRAPEVIAAVKWAGTLLKDPDLLVKGSDSVTLSTINESSPEGADILGAARHILARLGRPQADAISLADASNAVQIFADALFNGDGVIVPESAGETATKTVLEEIGACVGTVTDRSGKPGVDQTKLESFFAECAAFDAWWKLAENNAATILPLGEQTAAAAAAVKAAQAKVDDYFGRCRLAAFDSRAAAMVNRKDEDYAAILAKDISINASELSSFPLAQAAAGKALPLQGAVNPAHAAMLAALHQLAIQPLLGDKLELTEGDWAAVQARLAPFASWQAAQTGTPVAKLGLARVRQILGSPARQEIEALLARDKSFERQAGAVAGVEKLIRFVRDLHGLCLNFVNFKNLYAGDAPAIFQAGVLYLDQRSCHLCLTVDDAGRHSLMAGLAGAFLAYADCVRRGTEEKMSIVAIFSQGDDENLMVGRNGVFYDRKGRDYDATITKILPNAISLRQAFWAPYKKVVRLIEEQVSKRASAADASTTTQVAAGVQTPSVVKPKFDASVVALVSVALGSLATAFATFLAYLGKFAAWQLPLLVVGVMLIISGPSVLFAFVKLRRRNLGPILDANGWAINSSARINVPFGTRLTDIAELPPGSTLDFHDRYAEKTAVLPKV